MKVEVKQRLEDNYQIGVETSEKLIRADMEVNLGIKPDDVMPSAPPHEEEDEDEDDDDDV